MSRRTKSLKSPDLVNQPGSSLFAQC